MCRSVYRRVSQQSLESRRMNRIRQGITASILIDDGHEESKEGSRYPIFDLPPLLSSALCIVCKQCVSALIEWVGQAMVGLILQTAPGRTRWKCPNPRFFLQSTRRC